MSANGDRPKGRMKRPKRPRLVPLIMLGSDGETYACTPSEDVPPGLLKNPNVVLAIRLTAPGCGWRLQIAGNWCETGGTRAR